MRVKSIIYLGFIFRTIFIVIMIKCISANDGMVVKCLFMYGFVEVCHTNEATKRKQYVVSRNKPEHYAAKNKLIDKFSTFENFYKLLFLFLFILVAI